MDKKDKASLPSGSRSIV